MKSTIAVVTELSNAKAFGDDGYKNLASSINQVGDSHWYVEIETPPLIKIIDWIAALDNNNLPYSFLEKIQECCLEYINDYTNISNGRIVLRSKSQKDTLISFARFFSVFYKTIPSIDNWKKLSFSEIKNILVNDLDKYRKNRSLNFKDASTVGRGRILSFTKILCFFAKKGALISPLSTYELSYFVGNDKFLEDYLESNGLNWSIFNNPKHYNFIPFHIALPWINYIVQYFRTNDFRFWMFYWWWVREYQCQPKKTNFRSFTSQLRTVQKYVRGEYGNRVKSSYEISRQHLIKGLIAIFGGNYDLNDLLSWSEKQSKYISFSKDHLMLQVGIQLSHLYALIVMTNGARRSEIANLRLSDFREVADIVSNYKSFIHKTNDGLPTIRQISGIVHSVAKKVSAIGRIDRQIEGVNLFYYQPSRAYQNGLDIEQVAGYFNRSYQSFLNSLPSDLAEEMRQTMPRVTPHQGRHLFAAFSLRVSDGNVFEEIRKHYRHEYKSFQTNAYTEYKLSDLEQKFVEREFITEILTNIATKDDHGYFGPMLSTLEGIIDSHISFVSLDNIGEVRELCEKLADVIDTIKVHEWGFCIPVIKTLAKSKCWDKSAKIPLYDAGSSFKNCSGCIHLLSQKACLEDLQRIAMGLSQTIEGFPLLGNSMKKALELEFKRAVALIDQAPGN